MDQTVQSEATPQAERPVVESREAIRDRIVADSLKALEAPEPDATTEAGPDTVAERAVEIAAQSPSTASPTQPVQTAGPDYRTHVQEAINAAVKAGDMATARRLMDSISPAKDEAPAPEKEWKIPSVPEPHDIRDKAREKVLARLQAEFARPRERKVFDDVEDEITGERVRRERKEYLPSEFTPESDPTHEYLLNSETEREVERMLSQAKAARDKALQEKQEWEQQQESEREYQRMAEEGSRDFTAQVSRFYDGGLKIKGQELTTADLFPRGADGKPDPSFVGMFESYAALLASHPAVIEDVHGRVRNGQMPGTIQAANAYVAHKAFREIEPILRFLRQQAPKAAAPAKAEPQTQPPPAKNNGGFMKFGGAQPANPAIAASAAPASVGHMSRNDFKNHEAIDDFVNSVLATT